jgi:hypothetical protein
MKRLLLVIPFVLIGCGAPKLPATLLEKIHPGMTIEEVENILGEPTIKKHIVRGDQKTLLYSYEYYGETFVDIIFLDGRVHKPDDRYILDVSTK